MELFALLAGLVLLGLSLLWRRSCTYTDRAPPAPAVLLKKISDPAVAHRALVEDADAFSNRPDTPFHAALAKTLGGQRSESLNTVPYGPHWRLLRCNITSETLHPSRLAGHLSPLQREAIRTLVAGLSAAAGGDEAGVLVRDHFYAAVFPVAARLCFGDDLCVDECHVSAMRCVVQDLQHAIGEVKLSPGPATLARKLARWRQQRLLFALHGRMRELFLPLVAARRQRPRSAGGGRLIPYVDSLIHLRIPDGSGNGRALRDDEMVTLMSEFLGAGMGTVVVCLEWTLAHLVNNQEIQQKIRDEVDGGEANSSLRGMPYLHAVVMESLRMHPPVPSLLRHVQAGVLVGGAATSSDLFAQFLLGDIGRDSKTWKDPDEFRPERFLAGGEAEGVGPLPGPKEIRMMPFGAGHRFCPGVGLGMANIKCFLAALMREFEWAPPRATMDCGGVVDLTELDAFFKTMKKPLCAHLTPRT